MPNPTTNTLTSLDGMNGLTVFGLATFDNAGQAVSDAGDVNGDGFSDFLLGAPTASGDASGSGAAYVVFGRAAGFASNLNLTSLDGSNGFRLLGADAGDATGKSLRGIGDFNGDGVSDLIVGSQNFGPAQPSGAAYVVFGSRDPFPAQMNLDVLASGNGFRLEGAAPLDAAGYSVGEAGDINGDGLDDLVIGARSADPGGSNGAGSSYVVFGRAAPPAATLNLSGLDGNNGFKLSGFGAGSNAGAAVRGAGDVNGDGFDDLLIGAPYASLAGGGPSGAAFLIFGKKGGFGSNVDLAALDGSAGVQFVGEAIGDRAGSSVSGAGDINGDGFADILIGAPSAAQGSGAAYVVFGGSAAFPSQFSLTTLDGGNGFQLVGALAGDGAGHSVGGADDINGDGIDDLIVGAYQNDSNGTSSGAVYVVYGNRTGFVAVIALASLSGASGFQLAGAASGDFAGRAVSGAGDVNGDGFADLLVGATGADGNSSNTGAAYVIFGGDFNGLAGTMGTSSDDTLPANSGSSVFHAGAGNDRMEVDPAGLQLVDGGGGTDTLAVRGAFASLDLHALANTRITGIEVIDLEQSGSQSLSLAALDLVDLSDSSNTLRITGDGQDWVRLSGTWNAMGVAVVDGESHSLYRNGAATAMVESDVVVITSQRALASLDGINGFRMLGVAESDFAGRAVHGAGDVNGDGFDDVIIGAYGADGAALDRLESGASYVVFGRADGMPATIDLALLDGSTGFRIAGGAQLDLSGFSVSSAGDVNGDGLADLLIGAYGAGTSGSQAGAAYVVFGRDTGFDSTVDLALLDGQNGFALTGGSAFDFTGRDVSNAGDVNGDGLDDIIIGAHGADPAGSFSGASYVVFGRASGFASSFSLASLDGLTGFKLSGVGANHASGAAVSGAGDVNGDGFADLIVGAYRAGAADSRVGASYLVFGKASGFAPIINLAALSGMDGLLLGGGATLDYTGRSVSNAGDVNGDGLDDLLIGAYGADPNGAMSGTTYVVFGKATGFGSYLDLGLLNGTDGFAIEGAEAGERSGLSVSGAGDVNGDGFDDIIVGAYGATQGRDHTGAAYVVFGKASGFSPAVQLATLTADQGFQVIGEGVGDQAGRSVGAAGDINGDGFDDLVIGAYGADPNGLAMAGVAYVLFGGNFTGSVAHPGSTNADSLEGSGGADRMMGMQGNDTLAGMVGADVLHGGSGDDVLRGGIGADQLDGGPGRDTADYASSPQGVDVDLASGQAGGGDALGDLLLDIENLAGSPWHDRLAGDGSANFIDGGAGNDTLSGREGDDTLSGGLAFDSLMGGAGNDVLRGGEQADTLLGGDGDDYISAGKSTDSVDGGAGNDTLVGGLGTDLLMGGDGVDVADYSGSSDGVTVSLVLSTAQRVSAGTGLDTLMQIENLVGSSFNDTLTGNAGSNTLAGGLGADTLSGDAGFDVLDGGDGNDSLTGGLNADTLLGGAGDDWLGGGQGTDSLTGGDGNDTLVGGLGTDRLVGGAGEDHFVFRHALDGFHNIDTLADLEPGVDVLELSASIFGALAGSLGQKVSTGPHLAYASVTGLLGYDADGAGGAAAVTFAVVGVGTHPASLGNDFLIVA